MIELPRRSFITGLVSLLAAPAIVRASSLMPVRVLDAWHTEHVTFGPYSTTNVLKLRVGIIHGNAAEATRLGLGDVYSTLPKQWERLFND
jgi:hypothetical protein